MKKSDKNAYLCIFFLQNLYVPNICRTFALYSFDGRVSRTIV